MKAIRVHAFGEPEVLKLEEAPDPKAGPGQVLIDVKAAGVNPVDTYIRSGKYGPKEFPFIPGGDVAGVVEAVGSGATRFKPRDRVWVYRPVTGGYASKALADQGNVHPLPETLSFAQGAGIGVPYFTAYRGLHNRGQAKPGETVLVHGATGGVGIAAVQLARAHGCIVIGTGGSDAGRVLVLEQGAHHVLDHHDAAYLQKLMALTGGRGVDVILEMLANVNLAKDLTALAKYGRVVVIGSRGKIEIDPRDTMSRDAEIRGLGGGNATPAELASIGAAIEAGVENGTLVPVIDHELPLADAAAAHKDVMQGNSRGKIVLLP